MSVIEVGERIGRRRSGVRADGSAWYKRVYYVRTDNDADGGVTIRHAPGIPLRYTGYSTDTEMDLSALVRTLQERQLASSRRDWEVDVGYDSKRSQEENNENPLFWLPKVGFRPESYTVPVPGEIKQGTVNSTASHYEGAILTAAGDPIENATMEVWRPTLTILRNEVTFNAAMAIDFENAVNIDPYFGASPRQARLLEMSTPGRAKATVSGTDVYYYPITYRIVFKRETHDMIFLNAGPHYLTLSSTDPATKVMPFKDQEGHPCKGLLAANGTALDSSTEPDWIPRPAPTGSFTPTYIRKRRRKERHFSLLNLPNSMP
jgi:hypothetical protein